MAALVARSPWAGIARRLDEHPRLVEAGRQRAGGDERVVRRAHAIEEFGKDVVGGHRLKRLQ